MTIKILHITDPFSHNFLGRALCGFAFVTKQGEYEKNWYAFKFDDVNCHKCLEIAISNADRAAAQIIELDRQASEAQQSSNDLMKSEEVGATPTGRSKEELVQVHADGGSCHGVALVPDATCPGSMYCPVCGITPDMQSREFWPKSKVKDPRCDNCGGREHPGHCW